MGSIELIQMREDLIAFISYEGETAKHINVDQISRGYFQRWEKEKSLNQIGA